HGRRARTGRLVRRTPRGARAGAGRTSRRASSASTARSACVAGRDRSQRARDARRHDAGRHRRVARAARAVTAGPDPSTPATPLVDDAHVIVCCGAGGVGKTTVAASLAIEAARRGRSAVVVTIDPAKRLADTLGLSGLSNAARPVDASHWDPDGAAVHGGRLAAAMLDARTTFDGLVHRHAESEAQAERILANRFYRNIAGALSGTQEHMAAELLHQLHETGAYALIVGDTPPTRHALDFLDAPNRLARLLDNRIFRMLMAPARGPLHATTAAVRALLRTIGQVVGSTVVDDVVAFF